MTDVVLTTLNARYWHSSFGLRYLLTNMGSLRDSTAMLEFGIGDHSVEIVAEILRHRPRIVGIGVYIWNVEQCLRVVAELKRVQPELVVVLGGPEVSYETESQPICELVDYIVTGEADVAFPELCRTLIGGSPPAGKVIPASPPTFEQLQLPYDLYSDEDIAHRVIYVEASRGCPFTCEFCLSALEIPVRQADLTTFLEAMQSLLDRGARRFKFVDRTFNLNLRVSQSILQFFLDRYEPGLFLHFEMIPDRLPDSLQTLITKFPVGALQFEIGVQTFNDEVGDRISRRQDNQRLETNFRFLREQTGVHLHADLIVGLPGETFDSFGRGFDRLLRLDPQEIQVGILKRLRGTPIVRHDEEWQMTYSPHPPYEILCNRDLDFDTIHRLRHFARFWDLVGNSGQFVESRRLMFRDVASPFHTFLEFSDRLFSIERKTHGLSLVRLAEHVFDFLCRCPSVDTEQAALAVWRDYSRNGRHDRPAFLRQFKLPHPRRPSTDATNTETQDIVSAGGPQRQTRHLR